MSDNRTVFCKIVGQIATRPGMFVGTGALRDVAIYLDAYEQGLTAHSQLAALTPGWNRWIEGQFLIFHPAWHWSRILVHVFGSDETALAALPELYQQFFADLDTLGATGIEKRTEARLVAAYGEPVHEPEDANNALRTLEGS